MNPTLKQLEAELESNPLQDVIPEWAFEIPEGELIDRIKKIRIKAKLLPNGDFETLRVGLNDPMGQILYEMAERLGVTILPPSPLKPLDSLFCYSREDELIGPIEDLSLPLWKLLFQHRCKRKFGLELSLVFKINTTWKIAPKDELTPLQLLELCDMDYTQYTLYLPDSCDPLLLETPIKIERGQCFEAIRDGRYGGK